MVEVKENTEAYLSHFDALEKNRKKDHVWLRDLRQSAIGRFAELGFPTTHDEDWRHTSVAPIVRMPFRPALPGINGLTAGKIGEFVFGDMECCNLVFVNGYYSEELSSVRRPPKGMWIGNLAKGLREAPRRIEPYLARHAKFDENAFTALNTAFMEDGAFIYVPPRTTLAKTIHLLFITTAKGEATVAHPRTLIIVGSGSQATIVESYVGLNGGAYFTNAVTEVVAGSNAAVDHYRLQRESEEAFHVGTLQVYQRSSTSFSSHSISLGGRLVRNDVNAVLDGEGGDCSLDGLYVTKGRQHVDNHTEIDHAKPHCSSRELYKGILDDSSSGVFKGRIVVRPDAQKTNARQANKNLLLSEDALVNTTPQLEIYADDVKCTHGATIGQLDEQQLFYIRSRGIGEESARTLLTYAFASDILSTIKVKPFECQIDLVLLNRLSREGVKELA